MIEEYTAIETGPNPRFCLIWMHGLGADARDMQGLAEALPTELALRHVFLDAPIRPVTLNAGMPMRAWYDIEGLTLESREDKVGLLDSEQCIKAVMMQEMARGLYPSQIILAGFSQGGAMALFTALRTKEPLGGVIALSSYLPLAALCMPPCLSEKTPVFMGWGQFDDVVSPVWTKQSAHFLQEHHFKRLSLHDYPMAHAVCAQELSDIGQWLNQTVLVASAANGEKE